MKKDKKYIDIRGCYCNRCDIFIPRGYEILLKHYGRVCEECVEQLIWQVAKDDDEE